MLTWLRRYGVKHYSRGLWLCTLGGLTSNTADPEIARFVTEGGANRWMRSRFPDYCPSYRVRVIPPAPEAQP